MNQCFKVVLQRQGKYHGNLQRFTIVASDAVVAIKQATRAARREWGRSRWDAVELEKLGDVAN